MLAIGAASRQLRRREHCRSRGGIRVGLALAAGLLAWAAAFDMIGIVRAGRGDVEVSKRLIAPTMIQIKFCFGRRILAAEFVSHL
ncbi:hypothetical protein ACIP1U_01725 [Cupriavidus sp. NPDC089707]|uniref:hypothetical protein n=1 Tax=Cupriavidus sp. NPDC089707 TaxID=3363963 RepID=UPI003807E0E0